MNHLQKSAPPGRQEPDWRDIERAYKAGTPTLAVLAKRHGVAGSTISRRAKKLGWPKRLPSRPKSSAPKTKKKVGTNKANTRDLMRRMRHLLEHQIADIERSQKEGATLSDERAARTLSSMIRSLEKLLELEQTVASAPSGKKAADDSTTLNTDRLRADLEQRLSRLAAG